MAGCLYILLYMEEYYSSYLLYTPFLQIALMPFDAMRDEIQDACCSAAVFPCCPTVIDFSPLWRTIIVRQQGQFVRNNLPQPLRQCLLVILCAPLRFPVVDTPLGSA